MSKFIEKMFYKQRADFLESAKERDKKFVFPDAIAEQKDIFYDEDQKDTHRLDIFYPKVSKDTVLPVIVNVHGGGLLMGNKEFNRYFCAQLSTQGYLVFSIEYCLTPENQFYDQIHDLSLAMDYVQTHLSEYHGDPEHIYAVGDSGGACLLVYAAAAQKSQMLANAAQITPSALPLRALGLISGMFYTNRFDQIGMFLPKYLYGKGYKKSAFAPFVNPEHPEVAGSLPPCYLVTSQNDNLQHYTLSFEKALTANNVPHELLNFPKKKELTHAFSVFEPFLPESMQTIQAMTAFLRKY